MNLCFPQAYHPVSNKLLHLSVLLYQRYPVFFHRLTNMSAISSFIFSLYGFFNGDLCFSQTYHPVSIKLLKFSVLIYQRCPVFLPLLCQANKSLCTGINHTLNDKNKVCEMRVLKPPIARSTKKSTKIFKERKQCLKICALTAFWMLHGEKNLSIWNISSKLKGYIMSFKCLRTRLLDLR